MGLVMNIFCGWKQSVSWKLALFTSQSSGTDTTWVR